MNVPKLFFCALLSLAGCASAPSDTTPTSIAGTLGNWNPDLGPHAFLADREDSVTTPSGVAGASPHGLQPLLLGVVQTGTVDDLGTLDIPLRPIAEGDLKPIFLICDFAPYSQGVQSTRVFFSQKAVPEGASDLTAVAELASGSRESPRPGDRFVEWIYVARDVIVERPDCPEGVYSLDLKRGWNSAVRTFLSNGRFRLETAPVPGDLRWQLTTLP